MVDVLTEIIISKSVEMVSEYAGNPDHAPIWYDNIDAADWITEKPLKVGSQIAFHAQFLGKHLAYTYEIVELIPGEKLVMKTAEGPFPMETTYTWSAIDDRTTKMTLRNRGNPSGFSKIFAPVMSFMMKRANNKDLGKIKSIIEGQS